MNDLERNAAEHDRMELFPPYDEMLEPGCPELLKQLDDFYDDPITESSGLDGDDLGGLSKIIINSHMKKHGCQGLEECSNFHAENAWGPCTFCGKKLEEHPVNG